MSFAVSAWLWLLLLAPVAALLAISAAALHRRKLRRLFSEQMLARILPASVRTRRGIRDAASVLGMALLVVALAEPRFDKAVRTLNVRGTDMVLLLDLSRSMDARDVDPSRLERARREIADLGRQIEGDRVGLVVFAGGAYARLPLTADFKAIELVVSELQTDTFDSQGSDLGTAIRVALEMLERSRQESGQALLVLSDGEIHDADGALAAADAAVERKIPVFVMGIGVEASPIPLRNGQNLTWQGESVTTTPDFEILKTVARRTGGAFVSSNAGSRDMEQLYAELRRSIRAVERSTQQRETWRSAFQAPLGLGTMLLLLGVWLGDGRSRRFGAAAAVLLAVGLSVAPTARAADPLLEADRLYREGKLPAAIERLVELSLQNPDDPEILERLGSARYRAGDFEGAARAFDEAIERGGSPDADALFNSGNAYYMAGRLEDARDRYEEALTDQPEHVGATHNRDMVVQEIEARRAMQPPPPPEPQQGGSDEEEEGQGDDQQDQQQQSNQPQQQSQGGTPSESQQGDQQPQQGEDQQDEGGQSSSPQGGQQESEPEPSSSSPQQGSGEEGDPSEQNATGGGVGGEEEGPITAGQAHRLLDSVEEGTQRMVVQGRPDQKPW